MRVLITGANGSIGKKLIDKLMTLSQHDLVILTRKEQEAEKTQNLTIRNGDLLNVESLKRATKNIDIVVHLAGITHTNKEKEYYNVNLSGTKNLLNASEVNKVKKIIFISSRTASLHGGAYAKSKYLAQKQVEKFKYEWIILSPAEVYGSSSGEAISKLIRTIKKYPVVPVPGNGSYEISPICIDDVVDAIIRSMERPLLYKNYTLAGPKSYSYNELVKLIADIYGKKIIKIHIPLWVLRIVAITIPQILTKDQIPRLVAKKAKDINPAKRDLDFKPVGLKEGLRGIREK